MSRLPHDAYGFLTGVPVSIPRETRNARNLAAIRTDVRAIRKGSCQRRRIGAHCTKNSPTRNCEAQEWRSDVSRLPPPQLAGLLPELMICCRPLPGRSGVVATPLRRGAQTIERIASEATRDRNGALHESLRRCRRCVRRAFWLRFGSDAAHGVRGSSGSRRRGRRRPGRPGNGRSRHAAQARLRYHFRRSREP